MIAAMATVSVRRASWEAEKVGLADGRNWHGRPPQGVEVFLHHLRIAECGRLSGGDAAAAERVVSKSGKLSGEK